MFFIFFDLIEYVVKMVNKNVLIIFMIDIFRNYKDYFKCVFVGYCLCIYYIKGLLCLEELVNVIYGNI